MRKIVYVAAVLLFLSVVVSSITPYNSGETGIVGEKPHGAGLIDGFSIYGFVEALASERFRGRLTGDTGYTDAAAWVAGLFDKWGLKPVDDEAGFLLPFPVQYTLIESAEMEIYRNGNSDNGSVTVLEPGKDFLPLLYSDTADRTAGIVFAGWGIHAPELGYDDYFGIDAENKFVMCFRGTPDRAEPRFTFHDEHRTRMSVAKERGALGLIYIYDEPIANPNGDWISQFTPVKISSDAADILLGEKGFTNSVLREDLLKYKRPISFTLESEVRIAVQSKHYPAAKGYNVVGYIEGSDPAMKHEAVLVGAHLDHCGKHLGLLFGGANDNASGSAVVMEIARVFAQNDITPSRSVVFALFGAEEMGLIGSQYLADNFPEKFSSVFSMINFDMVGAGDGGNCGYSVFAPELRTMVLNLDGETGTIRNMFPIRELGVRGSDHAAFHKKGIPVLYFVSNGPHILYHQTGDRIYRINPTILEDIAKIGYLSTAELSK
jgi:hypothetical protein